MTESTSNQHRIMKTAIRFIQADHGPQVRAAVSVLAIAVAATYVLGYLTGQWVHNLNDSMAGFRLDSAALFQPAPAPSLAPVMIQRHASATMSTIAAPPIESLTVAELRKLARQAGHRKLARSGRRAQLLEVLV